MSKKLSELPVGAKVKAVGSKFYGKDLIFRVLGPGHSQDPTDSVILQTNDIISVRCFDAKEPNNSDSNRQNYGNNRYLHSNLLQWLNSDAGANAWYSAQHAADQKPDSANVWQNSGTAVNPYDTQAGFMNGFTTDFKNSLLTVTKRTAKNTVTDGGGCEDVQSKFFLLSTTEVGLANEDNDAEGELYSLFSDQTKRIMVPTTECANNSVGYSITAGSAWYWWLRTPISGDSLNVRLVLTDGSLYNYIAFNGFTGVAPACALSKNQLVSDTVDEDGAYRLAYTEQISEPTVSPTSYTYTGSTITPTITGYDSAKMTQTGVVSATAVGSYNVTYTPNGDYAWEDGTTDPITLTWNIVYPGYVSKENLSAIVTKINTKLSNRYTKAEVDSAISSAIAGVTSFEYQLVDEDHPLPATGTKGVIYLVPNNDSGTNTYNEKIWIVINDIGAYEDLGGADLDDSEFITIDDIKVGGLTKTPDVAGNGFTLSGNEQSTLSSGTGIEVIDTSVNEAWEDKTWNGSLPSLNGSGIWIDGDNIYYSNGSDQYILNKSTNIWNEKVWNGLTSFGGSNIWTDGENIYYSNKNSQYVLDKSTDTWNEKTWNDLTSFNGNNIWSDGNNIYYSENSKQYVLDKEVSTWNVKTWNGLTRFNGNCIWTDKENVYYSNNSIQCVLDKSTSTWNEKTWNKTISIDFIWTDGDNIYYSNDSNQYILNKSTSTWEEKTWNRYNPSKGNYIWTDGDNVYYSNSSTQYVLDKSANTWNEKTWNGLPISFSGENIWADGENIYYSNGGQYVLDKITNTWNSKIWNGYTNLNGHHIWTDEKNIYYSYGNSQYVLDKSTDTWNEKTWNDLTFFNGNNIWSDGNNIYYSENSKQYVLDKEVSTWNIKTWNGLTSFNSSQIWNDGNNIYYSNGSNQYILDKSTDTWSKKTWSGLTSFNGQYIWINGDNVYYSYNSKQYALDKSTSTWIPKTRSGLNNFNSNNIWTDGENIYYSIAYNQKVLVSISVQPSYQINTTSATQTSVSKANTAVQKSEIVGTTNQIISTVDVSGNGVTLALDSSLVTGAAAGNTALQADDINGLDTSDINELLSLIADDE